MFEGMVAPMKTTIGFPTAFNKEFHHMGGTMRYLSADNRDFLPVLVRGLEN